jgi:hypothetical protein
MDEQWTVILPDGTKQFRPTQEGAWRFAVHYIAHRRATHVQHLSESRTIKLEDRRNAN